MGKPKKNRTRQPVGSPSPGLTTSQTCNMPAGSDKSQRRAFPSETYNGGASSAKRGQVLEDADNEETKSEKQPPDASRADLSDLGDSEQERSASDESKAKVSESETVVINNPGPSYGRLETLSEVLESHEGVSSTKEAAMLKLKKSKSSPPLMPGAFLLAKSLVKRPGVLPNLTPLDINSQSRANLANSTQPTAGSSRKRASHPVPQAVPDPPGWANSNSDKSVASSVSPSVEKAAPPGSHPSQPKTDSAKDKSAAKGEPESVTKTAVKGKYTAITYPLSTPVSLVKSKPSSTKAASEVKSESTKPTSCPNVTYGKEPVSSTDEKADMDLRGRQNLCPEQEPESNNEEKIKPTAQRERNSITTEEIESTQENRRERERQPFSEERVQSTSEQGPDLFADKSRLFAEQIHDRNRIFERERKMLNSKEKKLRAEKELLRAEEKRVKTERKKTRTEEKQTTREITQTVSPISKLGSGRERKEIKPRVQSSKKRRAIRIINWIAGTPERHQPHKPDELHRSRKRKSTRKEKSTSEDRHARRVGGVDGEGEGEGEGDGKGRC